MFRFTIFLSFSKPIWKFSFDASSAQRSPFGYSRDFNKPLIVAHNLAASPAVSTDMCICPSVWASVHWYTLSPTFTEKSVEAKFMESYFLFCEIFGMTWEVTV